MDAKAQEIYVRLDELNKKYGELADTLKDFDNIDELVEGGADISFYKKNISQITDKLKAIKSENLSRKPTKSIKT